MKRLTQKILVLILMTSNLLYCEDIQIGEITYTVPSAFRFSIYQLPITNLLTHLTNLAYGPEQNRVRYSANPFISGIFGNNGLLKKLINKIDQHFLFSIKAKVNEFFTKLEERADVKAILNNAAHNAYRNNFLGKFSVKYAFRYYDVAGQDDAKVQFITEGITPAILEAFGGNPNTGFAAADLGYADGQQGNEKFAKLKEEIQQMCNNCRDHFENMFPKLISDINFIRAAFIPIVEGRDAYNIISVTLAQSDLHKTNGGVSILTMSNGDRSVKFVFKPSTVMPDFVITGNISELVRRLGLINNDYWTQKLGLSAQTALPMSLFEIMNEKLALIHPAPWPIPLYIVLPMEDVTATVQNRIRAFYGYIEFIESNPRPSDHSVETYQRIYPQDQENISSGDFSRLIVQTFQQEYMAQINADRFANAIDAEERLELSELLGTLTALVYTIGNNDLHFENVIFNNKRPYIIDWENSFGPFGVSSNPVALAFQRLVGAWDFTKPYLCSEMPLVFERRNHNLIDMGGERGFGSTNLFSLVVTVRCGGCLQPNLSIEPFSLHTASFSTGIERAFAIIQEHKERIIERWLDHRMVSTLIVREVPVPTPTWTKIRDDRSMTKLIDTQNDLLKIPQLDSYNFFRRKQMIFNQHTFEELERGLIPAYYVKVDVNGIYDTDGTQLNADGIIKNWIPYLNGENRPNGFIRQNQFDAKNLFIRSIYPENQDLEQGVVLQQIDAREYRRTERGTEFFRFGITPLQFVKENILRHKDNDLLHNQFLRFIQARRVI